MTAACCCHVCYVCQFLIFMASQLHVLMNFRRVLPVHSKQKDNMSVYMILLQYIYMSRPFDMNHRAKCAQVVFPLWTKWLVTNPMPTQHLGSNMTWATAPMYPNVRVTITTSASLQGTGTSSIPSGPPLLPWVVRIWLRSRQ